MSDGRRSALALALLAFGAAAITVAAGGSEESGQTSSTTAALEEPQLEVSQGDVLAELREHAEHEMQAREARASRRLVGDPTDEMDARDQEAATFATERLEAVAVARRFFRAFASYELGDVSPRIEGALDETTTTVFGRELVGLRAPRVPAGSIAPPQARVRALDFVPGESHGQRLLTLELVATVDRGGVRTPLAIALRRANGGWLVDALGR